MAHWMAHKAAWFPGRVRVCGRRLLPFTLGHLRLLECAESPYLAGGDVLPADLYAAVALIRLPWRVARWVLGRPRALAVAAWRISLGAGRRWDWREESEAFAEYIDDCLWTPDAYRHDAKDDWSVFGYASSFSLRVALRLAEHPMRDLSRHRIRQVWDLPITEALAWAVTASELSGRSYVTRDEMETVEAMAAQQVAKEACGGG